MRYIQDLRSSAQNALRQRHGLSLPFLRSSTAVFVMVALILVMGSSLALIFAPRVYCATGTAFASAVTGNHPTDAPTIPGHWTLVWSDEFNAPNGCPLDTSKWAFDPGGDGGGNHELEYYTDGSNNAQIVDGMLDIVGKKQSYRGKAYTSARISTKNLAAWRYGRIDVRAKLPAGQGLWPAIWMVPVKDTYGPWPASGEIDIMESLGQDSNQVYGTVHCGTDACPDQGSYALPDSGAFSSAYHIFSVVWTAQGISFYVDGTQYSRVEMGKPFDQPFYLILNLAVGGDWAGSPDADTTFPATFSIDYVRVFQGVAGH